MRCSSNPRQSFFACFPFLLSHRDAAGSSIRGRSVLNLGPYPIHRQKAILGVTSHAADVNSGIKLTLRHAPGPKVADQWMRLARTADFKATRLAQVAGVSPRTLQRHFKAEYRITVSEWLKRIRMREASERIQAGDRVKAVAMDLGYKQLSHFSREFKRAFGLPPTRVPSTAHKAQNTNGN